MRDLQAAELEKLGFEVDLEAIRAIPIVVKEEAEKGGKAGGEALAQGIGAGLGNLGDAIGEQIETLFDPDKMGLDKGLKGKFDALLKELDKGFGEGEKAFDNFASGMEESLQPLTDSLGDFGEDLRELGVQFGLINEKVDPIVQAFSALAATFQVVLAAQGIVALIAAIAGGIALISGFIATLGGISGILTFAVAALGGTVGVVVIAVIGALYLLYAAWETNFLGIRDILTGVWENNIKPAFESIGQWFNDTFPQGLNSLSTKFGVTWEDIYGAFLLFYLDIVAEWTGLYNWLTVTLPDGANQLKTDWDNKWSGISTKTSNAWGEVKGKFTELTDYLTVTIPNNVETTRNEWETKFNSIRDNVNTWWTENIKARFDNVGDALKNLIPNALADFWAAWEEKLNLAKDLALKVFGDNEGIEGFIEDVIDAVDELKRKIERFIEWLTTLSVPNPFDEVAKAIGGGGEGDKALVTVGGKSATSGAYQLQNGIISPPISDMSGGMITPNVPFSGTGNYNSTVYIDARGSNWTRGQILDIFKEAQREVGRETDKRVRTKPKRRGG
jgi:hypothetical protein